MSEISKDAAYIKGLFDGLELDPDKDVTKVLSAVVDFIQKAADQIEMLDQEQGFLADQIDDVEEAIDVLAEEIGGDEPMGDLYQIRCENCGEDIEFTEDEIDDLVEGNFECPNCGEIVELDLGDAECDCGCGHDHE